MYAAMAGWTAPKVANGTATSQSSTAIEVPTGPFVCPHCTFELTPPKNVRCGVCDMPRPGAEHLVPSMVEEEEEMSIAKSVSTRSSATTATKSKAAAAAANIAPETNSAAAKPPAAPGSKSSARLLLVSGKNLSNIIPTLVAQISRVTNIQNFDLEGNVDHVKRTRDAIVKRLKEGNSCLVLDSAVSHERQQAWITIAQRCGVECDVLVGTALDLVCNGFVHQYLPPFKYESIREAFASSASNKSTAGATTMSVEQKIATPKARPIPSTPSTGSTNPGTNCSNSSSLEIPSSAVSILSATKKTALASNVVPIDLTGED